jgi:hypothetical protein
MKMAHGFHCLNKLLLFTLQRYIPNITFPSTAKTNI